MDDMNYKIGYYVLTDIQHLPPVIRLYPYLGGNVYVRKKEIYDHLMEKYKDLNINAYYCKKRKEAQRLIRKHGIRVMIYPSFHTTFVGKAVEIFHGGLSDKNYVESLKILQYDFVLFPGEKTKDKVQESGYLKHIPNWKIIGYPKFDPLIKKSLDYTPLFNNGRKTVLYAPTWISQEIDSKIIKFSEHGESSLELWGKEIIKALHKDYNLIIKYHSRIFRKPGDIYEQIDELIKTLGAEAHVKVNIDDNILPFMAQADLMISDISTACYEWFHFDRPIVYANPAPEHYVVSDDIRSNTYAWQAGDVFGTAESILPIVNRNIESDVYQQKRNEIFNYTVFQPDGHATERQANAIIDFYQRYIKTPYWWLFLTSMAAQRHRRNVIKLRNWYYRIFDKSRIGK